MVTTYKVFATAKHSISVVIINWNSKLLLLHYHRTKKEKKVVILTPYFPSETK